jgi:Flp pilus assembly protein TadD
MRAQMPAVVFAVALILRGVHLWMMRDSPYLLVLMGDARAYDEWATQLAAGDWIGREVFYQAPLYPYVLGAIYAIAGRDLFVVRVVQVVIGAASAALLADAASRLYSRRVGIIAGALMAFYAPAIFLGVVIQKSVLDVFLMCAALWVAARVTSDTERRGWWFTLGGILGLLSLSRENALLLVAAAVFFAGRRSGPVVVLGAALVLTPVALRNYAVGGGFYITTSQFGPNFYIGNNPRADGTYQALREGRGDAAYERQDATELAEAAMGRQLTAAEVSTYWRNQAFEFIVTQPGAWLRLMGRKALLLVSATELPDTEAQEAHAESSLVLRLLQPWTHFGVMLPLAAVGLAVAWQRNHRTAMILALGVAYAISVLIFFVFARYRYPLVPFVLMFAACGIDGMRSFVRGASLTRKAAVTVAAVALALLAFRPVLASDAIIAVSATNAGVALQAQGRLDEAAAQYRHAIATRPDYAPAHNNLGVVLLKRGNIGEAIAAYQHALAYHPDDPGTRVNLALALVSQGRRAEALPHYRRVVELEPLNMARRYDLGNLLLEMQDAVAAEKEFRTLVELAPDAAQAHSRLGIALAQQSRFDEAAGAFRTALALRPGYPEAERYLTMVLQAARQ